MKIIDSKKCYYDYLQGIIGMDDKVVYDRRGSKVVSVSVPYIYEHPVEFDLYFSKNKFKCDAPKKRIKGWSSAKYEYRVERWKRFKHSEYIEEGDIYHLFLEVGFHQFIFEVERYLDKEKELHVEINLVKQRKVEKDKKKSKAPLFIGRLNFKYYDVEDRIDGVENPILVNTWIPKFISANDMWNMLYEYISSLNDKEFVDTRTNEQHIESNGFDKKISFRHRK